MFSITMEKQKLDIQEPEVSSETDGPVATQILNDFADVSTCHGVGRISGSKPLWLKISWALITLTAFTVFCWQLFNLADKFYSYPVTVEISHEFKELDFPAVSFCNLNRFRSSMRSLGGSDFNRELARYEAASNEELSGAARRRKRREAPSRVKRAAPDNSTAPTEGATTAIAGTQGPVAQITTTGTQEPIIQLTAAGTQVPAVQITTAGAQDTAGPATHAATPPNQGQAPQGIETFLPAETEADEKRGDPSNDYFTPNVDLENKPWFNTEQVPTISSEIAQNLTALLRTVSLNVQRSMGHRVDNMIHECSWAGKQCTPKEFTGFSHPDYGNCYTFNEGLIRPILTVEKEGPLYGLSLVLYIEQMEYIKVLSPTAGARLLVHHQDEQPFPEDDGFDINPGQKVSVKLGMKKNHRLPDPYSECLNTSQPGDDFLYNKNYSVKACRKSCIQRNTLKECNCGNPGLPLVSEDAKSCPPESFSCMRKVAEKVLNGTIEDSQCACPSKCRDVTFTSSLSAAEWPGDAYLDTVAAQYSTRSDALAKLLYNSSAEVRKNFLKIEVFYEELRFMTSVDVPAYGLENLFGDIGGQLGLWIGISVITIVEFVQLVIELMTLCCRKGRCTPKKQ